ncbi:MAG: UDP-N-acetylglucosamine 1-carboxyvinyltransferase [Myxococcota bacterium]
MEKFVIEGGHRLSGAITPGGSKNEVLPCLAATLLTDERIVLNNVPRIRDVEAMLDVLRGIGGEVEWIGDNAVAICNANIDTTDLPVDLCKRIRASILFAGAMLGRMSRVTLPPPGGDVIGRRRLDTHFLGLRALGAEIGWDGHVYQFSAQELHGTDIFLDEPSVTGTENIIMAAVVAKGVTVIRNAACEPHVQGLCRLLVAMGAHIEGVGTNVLTIRGSKSLWGAEHTIGPDYLEIGSLVGLAAVTRSELTIRGVVSDDLRKVQMVLGRLGIALDFRGNDLVVAGNQSLEVRYDFHNEIPKIDSAPWPAFPTDLMSIAITVATQVKGTVLFFEKMFDGRMFFVDGLIAMGARIILCDPHRVVVVGPAQLYGATLESPDIRAGMALLIAALAAQGTSTMYNIRQIDRGYERIDDKLRAVGAHIERLPA